VTLTLTVWDDGFVTTTATAIGVCSLSEPETTVTETSAASAAGVTASDAVATPGTSAADGEGTVLAEGVDGPTELAAADEEAAGTLMRSTRNQTVAAPALLLGFAETFHAIAPPGTTERICGAGGEAETSTEPPLTNQLRLTCSSA
jgi:hypothetical protein